MSRSASSSARVAPPLAAVTSFSSSQSLSLYGSTSIARPAILRSTATHRKSRV